MVWDIGFPNINAEERLQCRESVTVVALGYSVCDKNFNALLVILLHEAEKTWIFFKIQL